MDHKTKIQSKYKEEEEGRETLAGKEATNATLINACKGANPTGMSPRNLCIWTAKER